MKNIFLVLLLIWGASDCASQVISKEKPTSIFQLPAQPNGADKQASFGYDQLPVWARQQHFLADTTDSSKQVCCCGCLTGEAKVLFLLDSRQSFFAGQWIRMNGFRMGLELYDRYRIGLGAYFSQLGSALDQAPGATDGLRRTLRFNYSTLFFEYVAYRDFRWEASVPFGIGSGVGRIDTLSLEGGRRALERADTALVLTIGMAGHYRIIPWLGVGAGVGYRQMFASDRSVGRVLSAPYYSVKLKIFLGYLFKSMFQPHKIEDERNQYLEEKRRRQQERLSDIRSGP